MKSLYRVMIGTMNGFTQLMVVTQELVIKGAPDCIETEITFGKMNGFNLITFIVSC